MFPMPFRDPSAGGFALANSLLFDSASSQYLSRTVTTSTTFTLSVFVKRSKLSSIQGILEGALQFDAGDTITAFGVTTTAVFRDTAAWYHIIVNNSGLYVNGVSYGVPTTSALTDPDIGRTGTSYFDGYIADLILIDGTSVAYTSFGETNSVTGQWIPKRYSGSYGAKGFKLMFGDGTSTTTLGYDTSGNGNHWTLNSMTTANQHTDTPTNNYCTLNPLDCRTANTTFSKGDLAVTGTYNTDNAIPVRCGFAVSSGKWGFEFVASAQAGIGNSQIAGFMNSNAGLPASGSAFHGTYANYFVGGVFSYGGNTVSKISQTTAAAITGSSSSLGDVNQVLIDLDAGKYWLGKGGQFWNASNTLGAYDNASPTGTFTPTGGYYFPWFEAVASGGNTNVSKLTITFGQRPLTYDLPAGFKALRTGNLPVPAIKKPKSHFSANIWSGNGAARSITGIGHQPSFLWIKERSSASAYTHLLQDAVRGVDNWLASHAIGAEAAGGGAYVTSFDSDGFSLGGGSNNSNGSGLTYVGWSWKGNGAGAANTDGSISATVSANTTAGFSIVTYTGTGANGTVGHGLGVAPKMVIIKNRSSAQNWPIYHASLTSAAYCVYLNLTNAQASTPAMFNSTAPSSSVFSVGTNANTNNNTENHVAYCFAEVTGFSKFGSYVANNNADGPFINCGFRPAYVLIKEITAGGYGWIVYDTARKTFNVSDSILLPNAASQEITGSANTVDILSNGFKIRVAGQSINVSGSTFIYAAFAESPFKYANAR